MTDRELLIAFLDAAHLPYETNQLRDAVVPATTNRRHRAYGDIRYVAFVDLVNAGMFEVAFDETGQFESMQKPEAPDA